VMMVMEMCAGGDLLAYVRRRKRLSEPAARKMFKQLVDGLIYLNSKNIIHRDIKLDNLFLHANGILKIGDFGVSKLMRSKQEIMMDQCGTPAYIAPEILL
jgi:serine/threonine protein kinase